MDSRFFKQHCFVNGQWVSAKSSIDVINPSSAEVIGGVPRLDTTQIRNSITNAHEAFLSWRALSANERAAYCMAFHDALMDNREELGRLLTIEMGKPVAESIGEVTYGASFFKWFGEEARRVYGDIIPSPWSDKRILVTKEPVGVVGSITPWNFPNAMIARKAAAALASGCTIVCKPASQTPFSALAFGVIAEDIGLPAGVLNIVTGSAPEIANEMCANPKLRKITFTGSTEIGKELAANASRNMKRISMELGGNAPFIVFEDADIDRAVDGAIICKFRNSGQTCVCANRIYVHSAVYEEFATKFSKKVADMKVGDGLEDGVEQGPLIDMKGVEKVEQHIEDASSKGAKILTGGSRHELGKSFFEPTVLKDVTSDMLIARDETFGPVAPLFKFETEEQVINLANDTEFGLASYVYTRDLGRTWRVMEALEYGMVAINEGILSTEVAPFGGVKDSGSGREGSRYGIEDYINIKYGLIGGIN